MKIDIYKLRELLSLYITPFLLLLTLSSCVYHDSPQGESQSPAIGGEEVPLPRYIPGTTYVFADRSWKTIERIEGETISWKNNKGYTIHKLGDFTFRSSNWRTKTQEGSRQFSEANFLLQKNPMSLWPLQQSNVSAYYEDTKWRKLSEAWQDYKAYWKCTVNGPAKVTVPAGIFETQKITCTRYSASLGSTTSAPREKRTWYYAPKISYWVAYEREYLGENNSFERIRLMAIIPSLDREALKSGEKNKIEQFYQNTMNNGKEQVIYKWQSLTQKSSMTLTPKAIFKQKSGTLCRQYQQRLTLGETTENYSGIACKKDNIWSVPMRDKT